MKKFGVDLSKWNGKVDFKKLKEVGVEFVILRCGYASTSNRDKYAKDPLFEEYYVAAKSAGLDVGTYFYSMLNGPITGKAEAEYIYNLIKDKQFEYPVWLDVENTKNLGTNSKECITTGVEACLEYLKERGYYVGIYTGKYLIRDYMIQDRIDKYDLWIAQWSKECTYNGNLCMWQFGGETNQLRDVKIEGISSASTDQNYCYKDYPTIIKNGGYNGYTKTTTSNADTNVKNLQTALNKSYNCKLDVDGLFGPLTQTIVKKYYLKSVTKNEHAKWLQQALKSLGYNITIDGSYGPATATIVKQFQKSQGISSDGYAGLDTHTKLINNIER